MGTNLEDAFKNSAYGLTENLTNESLYKQFERLSLFDDIDKIIENARASLRDGDYDNLCFVTCDKNKNSVIIKHIRSKYKSDEVIIMPDDHFENTDCVLILPSRNRPIKIAFDSRDNMAVEYPDNIGQYYHPTFTYGCWNPIAKVYNPDGTLLINKGTQE